MIRDAAAHPLGILGSDKGRSGVEEGIKNNLGGGGIGPQIGAMASMLAERNAVDAGGKTFLEKRQ